MKDVTKSPSPRKPSRFDPYVAERSAHIEKMVEQTLRSLDATHYLNLTDYCKAVAIIVSQIRAAKAGDPTSPFFSKPIRPLSHITLLRNPTYRRQVEGMFNHSRGTLEEPPVAVEDANLKIASLAAQVNLLKDRLSGISTGTNSHALADSEANANIDKLRDYLALTLEVYTKLRSNCEGLLKTVTTPTPKYETPGFYGVNGKIAEIEDIQKIEEGRKFLKEVSKSKL